jgi:hypothetical protein
MEKCFPVIYIDRSPILTLNQSVHMNSLLSSCIRFKFAFFTGILFLAAACTPREAADETPAAPVAEQKEV